MVGQKNSSTILYNIPAIFIYLASLQGGGETEIGMGILVIENKIPFSRI